MISKRIPKSVRNGVAAGNHSIPGKRKRNVSNHTKEYAVATFYPNRTNQQKAM
jgi:hypothetical protein